MLTAPTFSDVSGKKASRHTHQIAGERLRYWQGLTYQQTAGAMGYTSPEQPRQLERKAFRTLSRSKEICSMKQYIDRRTDFYRGGFNPVESNVIHREELEGQYTGGNC